MDPTANNWILPLRGENLKPRPDSSLSERVLGVFIAWEPTPIYNRVKKLTGVTP
jgi:hypothetical protein